MSTNRSGIPLERDAARAILLNGDRVLLIHTFIPDSGKLIWLTPGGGVEDGETHEACLYREIFEETGLRTDRHDGWVWHRKQTFTLHDVLYTQAEKFYLVHVPAFEPTVEHNPAALERDIFRGFKWWSVDEINVSDDIFVPLSFADHLRELVANGAPRAPIPVGP